ncbi:hypothetical protein BC937DRAFT_88144 [Endogone sp. FLAS-F59071]|nr:hypothetical protein BC937DRAFT_88144 [Endogone sp. FLAS-F59071]|eukprot:RUS18942.1 hypothetical protein BC937DRAFT_88144 [Endogone sp. FLAS-F59071]
MCKHILNAQASIRAPCCKKWFDCPECHAEVSDHPLRKTTELVFACKMCKKVFRKDMRWVFTNFANQYACSQNIEHTHYGIFPVSEITPSLSLLRSACPLRTCSDYSEEDEYCPHCDNKYVVDAKMRELGIGIEGEDLRVDSRLIKDDRIKQSKQITSIFDIDGSDLLG